MSKIWTNLDFWHRKSVWFLTSLDLEQAYTILNKIKLVLDRFQDYSECLKSELAWILDSSVVSHSQTLWISDSVRKTNVRNLNTKKLGHFI